jgi:hypothetical protein
MSHFILDRLGSAYAALIQMEPLALDANEDQIHDQQEALWTIHQYCGQMTALANGLYVASSAEAEVTLGDGSGEWGKCHHWEMTLAN